MSPGIRERSRVIYGSWRTAVTAEKSSALSLPFYSALRLHTKWYPRS